MREAVGGSLLLYLVIPIIIIFIVFIGFIMNYAAAYRAANYVVSQIENCQGRMNKCGKYDSQWKQTITDQVRIDYKYKTPDNSVIKSCYVENGKDNYVFRVSLPISFDIPLLGVVKPMVVKAETKTIHNVPSNYLADFSKCEEEEG